MQRREFIKTSSAVAALTALHTNAYAQANDKKKRVGLIGCGWYGTCDLLRLIQVAPVDVVALCDVDTHMYDDTAKLVMQRQKLSKKPPHYGDYRKMLADHKFDIVLIGTPDHWHALTMIAAVKAGADVYCQKPISRDIVEGQSMLAAARKYGRVVQVGTQRRSTPHLIECIDRVVKEGKLGKIGHVDICCYYPMRANGNPPVTKPPEFFDYEMWTGPAPLRPYDAPANPDVPSRDRLPHRRWWRTFNEYGNGIVGDMCIHMLDMVRWMLDLGWPARVSSSGGIYVQKEGKSNISDTQTATFEFPEFNVVWQHRTWGDPADRDYPWSGIIYGEKGTLKADVHKYEFFPAGKKEPSISGKAKTEEGFPEDLTEKDNELHAAMANRWHQKDFLKAIESRGKPVADIEQGYISTASSILANISMEVGRTLQWDPKANKIVGDDEANKLLRREYRTPWEHPEPDNV
jgi:predicted dehydrogenase